MMMRVLTTAATRTRRALAPLRRVWRGRGGVVLLYHRIADPDRDPQRLATSPGHFAAHLAFLKAHGVVMTLAQLVDGAASHSLPRGAVAVTFDDGYADNLHAALPILEAAGVPATVFVTTGAVDAQREFWWDELEQILLGAATTHADTWTVDDRDAPSPRHQEYRELAQRFRSLHHGERIRELDALAGSSGTRVEVRSSRRPLTPAEVSSLAASPFIEIGAHTVTHTALAHLSADQQRAELDGARRRIQEWIGRPVTLASYPFGGRADVAATTAIAARESGLTLACTTEPRLVTAATNRHRVPRFIVRNWPVEEFAARWHGWVA